MNLPEKTQHMVDELLADFKVEDSQQMLECAAVNLEQLWKFVPALDSNPIYAITIVQLRSAMNKLYGHD